MSEIIRPLTPQETCAMYHYHNEYASLGIGAIAYYKGLSPRDKRFIDDMTAAILKSAQQRAVDATRCECGLLLDIDGMCPDIANVSTHRR